jgi:hypothetical protein
VTGARYAGAMTSEPTDPLGRPVTVPVLDPVLEFASLRHTGLTDRSAPHAQDVLYETGLGAESLHLGLTATVMMSASDTVQENIARRRALGVRLHIDNPGYSSLSHLQLCRRTRSRSTVRLSSAC